MNDTRTGGPSLAGRRVVVTGATSGIGGAVRRALLARGARVAALGRRAAALSATPGPGELIGVTCDLTKPPSIDAATKAVSAAFDAVDACVLAAGSAYFAPLIETDDAALEGLWVTNFRGHFQLLRGLLGAVAEGGSIVCIGSVAAQKGFAGCTAYAATKAAMAGMVRALREELRPRRIRVAMVTPGATDTPIWDGAGDFDRSVMLEADDVAHVVAAILEEGRRSHVEEVVVRPVGGDL